MKLSILVILLSLTMAGAQDTWKNVYTESAWADRDLWQKPEELIRQLALTQGSKVADIGCHEGYLAVKLSAAVGPKGKVYAVDVEKEKLDHLSRNLENRKISNVIPVKGELNDPLLPPMGLDAVIILDAYHEMDHHQEILKHIRSALKPGGRLVICEPLAEERRASPRPDQERKHELGMRYALEDLRIAGFIIIRRQDPFLDRTKEKGDKMWLIVAKK